jgi:hypothetical protein
MGDAFQMSKTRIPAKTVAVHCNGDVLFGLKKTRGLMIEAMLHAKAMAKFGIPH